MELEGRQAHSLNALASWLGDALWELQGGVCAIWKDNVRLLQIWGVIMTRVD